jgi:ribonucleoside-diphosphate reductase alpha chain
LGHIERITKANRKIGLGVMGFAELLIQLGIPYDSEAAVRTAEKVMRFITETARKESEFLAMERGDFPNKQKSVYKKYIHMRNATATTIAPTGTISIIAGCSSGIEPLFAVSFVRNVLESAKLIEVNHYFELAAREKGFYSKELMMQIARVGSVQHANIPEIVKRVFKTALDIKPEWHVKIQAAFQKYTDNAVSKTINLPETATPEDVRGAFLLAWRLGCKGITVYRYGSKKEQVLKIGVDEEHVSAESEYSGGCPKKPYCEV